jgi:outer membrane murein-binding lipoprotein Lpp
MNEEQNTRDEELHAKVDALHRKVDAITEAVEGALAGLKNNPMLRALSGQR